MAIVQVAFGNLHARILPTNVPFQVVVGVLMVGRKEKLPTFWINGDKLNALRTVGVFFFLREDESTRLDEE